MSSKPSFKERIQKLNNPKLKAFFEKLQAERNPFGERPRAENAVEWEYAREGGGGLGLVLFALVFVVVGSFVFLSALGIIQGFEKRDAESVFVTAIVGIVFFFAGSGMCVHGARTHHRMRQRRQLLKNFSETPWRVDFYGEERRIRDPRGFEVVKGLSFAFVISLFLLPFNYFIFFAPDSKNLPIYIKIFIGLFDVIALNLWVRFFRSLVRFLKFPTPELILDICPSRLGQRFGCQLKGLPPVSQLQSLRASLRCLGQNVYVTGSGKNRSRVVEHFELFKEDREIPLSQVGSELLHLQWSLPEDAALGTRAGENIAVFWELLITGQSKGIDYEARFRVPIYARS